MEWVIVYDAVISVAPRNIAKIAAAFKEVLESGKAATQPGPSLVSRFDPGLMAAQCSEFYEIVEDHETRS